ncbi:MAG: glycosyltransferase family 9 protein, partial [Bdellovibrionaceae bacterium]|nr:glycosyltransferase family 9 protein [Pseudobdellovibrionaceae bacterium]
MKPKILALCLLRLGDIILATPVLRGLRERHPDAEIHILINSQFAQIRDLIPYVDHVHLFDRADMQKGLGEAGRSLFEPYERLRALITRLENQRYTQVINLTQNRLSGYLTSMIQGPVKIGLALTAQGLAAFNSPWFRYLNAQADEDSDLVFHYSDVFRFALGLEDGPNRLSLHECPAGQDEAKAFLPQEGRRLLLVQPLTSDSKKDWGLERFHELIRFFCARHEKFDVVVLGSPAEREKLQPMVDSLAAQGLPVRLAICSLAGAYSLLVRAAGLVTGDTSIKHLACAAGTPLVELSLGSSDYRRTGAYLQNSIIVQARELCAPCPHSKACHRDMHACAARIRPEAVAMVLSEVVANQRSQLRVIAQEFADEVEILCVEIEESGFWAAHSVLEPFSEVNVARWLWMSGQKAQLEEERLRHQGGWGEIGTESVRLERLLRRVYPSATAADWVHLLDVLERQAMLVESRLGGIQLGLKSLYGNFENAERLREFVRMLIAFREKIKSASSLVASRASLDRLIEDDIAPPFVRFRRIVDAVQELRAT